MGREAGSMRWSRHRRVRRRVSRRCAAARRGPATGRTSRPVDAGGGRGADRRWHGAAGSGGGRRPFRDGAHSLSLERDRPLDCGSGFRGTGAVRPARLCGFRRMPDPRREDRAFLELGPGPVLGRRIQGGGGVCVEALPESAGEVPELPFMLAALGRLWLSGVRIDWSGFHAHERRRRVPLPTYPFERRRFAVAPPSLSRAATRAAGRTLATRNPGRSRLVLCAHLDAGAAAGSACCARAGRGGRPVAGLRGRVRRGSADRRPLGVPGTRRVHGRPRIGSAALVTARCTRLIRSRPGTTSG